MSNKPQPTREGMPASGGGMFRGPGGMMRGSGMGRGGPATIAGDFRKPKDMKGTLRKLTTLFAGHRRGLIAMGALAVLSTLFATLGPYVLGLSTNEILAGFGRMTDATGGVNFDALVRILLTLAGVYLLSDLFSYLQMLISATVTQKVMYSIRGQIDQKIRRLPLCFFDSHPLGDILSRVTNDVDTMSMTLQQYLPQFLSSLLTLIMVFIAMMGIGPLLTLLGLASMPLSVFFAVRVMRFSQKNFRGQQKGLGEIGGYVEEIYSGHNVIKVFGREERVCEEFTELNDKLYGHAWKAQFVSGLIMPVSIFFGNIGYVLVASAGAVAAVRGQMRVGSIQSMIQYLRQFSQPINQLTNMTNLIQSTLAAAERVFSFLGEEEEPADLPESTKLVRPRGEVSLSHVRFGYAPDEALIGDLSIDLRNGDKIAIVGPTGAGKTTLVNLLLRFYDIQGGKITIDGVDIMEMRRSDLRSLFGMVLQDTWLFSGTIAENIRYGRLDATDEEVRAAAKSAYADTFIRTMPGGYNTLLGEDASNISQGQRQLLTIARAILSNPTILILDEATSSVDTRTEVLIQKAMLRLMENRTSFVIAHRLSTIRDAQMIMVIDNGAIVETGNHKELLAKGGFYCNLYNSQFVLVDD